MPANTANRGYTYSIPTDPANVPAALEEFATDVDNDVEVNLAPVAPRPRALGHVKSSSVQTLQKNITTFLNYQIEVLDTDNMVDLINFPTQIKATAAGFYMFQCRVTVPDTNWSNLVLRMMLNTTTEIFVTDQEFRSGAQSVFDYSASWAHPMAAGDTMAVSLQHNGTGPLWVTYREFYGMRMAT